MRAISIFLFGGCFEHKFTSSTCDWYEWKQHRSGLIADKVNKLLNPEQYQ